MPTLFQRNGMISAAITAGLLLLTLIMTLTGSFVPFLIFLVLTLFSLSVTLKRLDMNLLHWVKLCWPVLPLLMLILLSIAVSQVRGGILGLME